MKPKIISYFLFIFIFTLSFNISYSALVHAPNLAERADYIYFVNNSNLDILIDFQSVNKNLIFESAKITTLSGMTYSKKYNLDLEPREEVSLNLDIISFENNISELYSKEIFEEEGGVFLELIINEVSGDRYLDETIPSSVIITLYNPSLGISNSIFFNYQDNPKPISLETTFIPTEEYTLNILGIGDYFTSYTIINSDDEVLETKDKKNSYSLSELSKSINLNYLENYEPGTYNFNFKFTNIAGTYFEENFQVIVEEEYLDIDVLTSEDDSNLVYFYDDNVDLYGNKIFSENKEFTFSIKTNKQAICYMNYNSVGSQYISTDKLFSEGISQKMNFNGDSFVHSIDISPFLSNDTSKFFWVGCTDMSGFEKKTLHSTLENLNNPLQNLQFIYHDTELILDLIYPTDSLLTNNLFTTRLSTSTKAICTIEYNNLVESVGSIDYLDHQKQFNLENGVYQLTYLCTDILNKDKSITKSIEIDNTRGVRINTQDKYFSAKNLFELEFTTSSITESCRYTREPQSTDQYESFALIGSDSNTFTVTLSPLVPNENKYFITCKSSIFSTKEILVIFDQSGPILSNLSFKSNGFISPNYVSDAKEAEVIFSVNSQVPIKDYVVELSSSNATKKFNLSGSSKTGSFDERLDLNEVLKDFTSIKISATNSLDKTGNILTKQLLFDTTKPEVRILRNGSSWEFACIDIETQCSKILYGFSNLEINCNPSFTYKKGELIDHTDNAFICARGINNVGLISDTISSATGAQIKTSPDTGDIIVVPVEDTVETDNPFETDLDENASITEEPEPTPREPATGETPSEVYSPEEESSNTIIILSALAVILLLAGGSGYYAYKKGYLNSQLEKLGIKLPNQSSSTTTTGNQSSSTYYSSMDKGTTNSGVPKLVGSAKDKKSKYDEHLSKLNSFLDETLDKKKGVFDSFKPSQKGRVESYNDTLARPVKGAAKKDKEFDEFYSASSSKNTTTSSENEADKFEEYYKKKKSTQNSSDKVDKKKQ